MSKMLAILISIGLVCFAIVIAFGILGIYYICEELNKKGRGDDL